MSLIAASIASSGVARIFFDMRPIAPSPEDLHHIAVVIERAFAPADIEGPYSPAPSEHAPARRRLE